MNNGLGIALIAGLGLWAWSKSKAAAATLGEVIKITTPVYVKTDGTTAARTIYVTRFEADVLKAGAGTPESIALATQIANSTELQAVKARAAAEGWTSAQLATALAANPTALNQAVTLAKYELAVIGAAQAPLKQELAAYGVDVQALATAGIQITPLGTTYWGYPAY